MPGLGSRGGDLPFHGANHRTTAFSIFLKDPPSGGPHLGAGAGGRLSRGERGAGAAERTAHPHGPGVPEAAQRCPRGRECDGAAVPTANGTVWASASTPMETSIVGTG